MDSKEALNKLEELVICGLYHNGHDILLAGKWVDIIKRELAINEKPHKTERGAITLKESNPARTEKMPLDQADMTWHWQAGLTGGNMEDKIKEIYVLVCIIFLMQVFNLILTILE